MLASGIIFVGLYMMLVKSGPRSSGDNLRTLGSLDLIMLASAVTLGVAPLHIYDFVMVGVLLFLVMQGGATTIVLALVGAAMVWRSDDLGFMTGFYGQGTEHFEGTRLATYGAILMMAAVFMTLRRRLALNENRG